MATIVAWSITTNRTVATVPEPESKTPEYIRKMLNAGEHVTLFVNLPANAAPAEVALQFQKGFWDHASTHGPELGPLVSLPPYQEVDPPIITWDPPPPGGFAPVYDAAAGIWVAVILGPVGVRKTLATKQPNP